MKIDLRDDGEHFQSPHTYKRVLPIRNFNRRCGCPYAVDGSGLVVWTARCVHKKRGERLPPKAVS